MRPILLAAIGSILLATLAAAQEYVVTPEGHRARLELAWYGPTHKAPYTTDVPVEKYTFYKDVEGNRVLHGEYARLFVNGRMKDFTTYVHGVKDGPFGGLSDNKQVSVTGQYRNGRLEGAVTWYYDSGVIQKEEFYVAGELHGPFAAYHDNGNKKEVVRFVRGRKDGPFIEYHRNGQPAFEGTYVRGYITGKLTVYGPLGVKRGEGLLDEEWIVGGWQCFAPNGQLERVRSDCDGSFYMECTCP